MKKFIKILVGITGVLVMLAVAAGVISYGDVVDFVTNNSDGVVYGMATVAVNDTVSTAEGLTAGGGEFLDNKISKKITKIKPSKTPIDTLIRSAGIVVPAKSWKYEYYSVDTRGREDTLSSAFDTSASGTFDSANDVHTINVSTASMWNKDDNILVQGISGSDSDDLVLHIIGKTGSTLSVMPLNGTGAEGKDIPDIASGTKITRLGPAKAEKDAQTTPYGKLPDKSWNYNQIFMEQVEESVYEALHTKEVEWGLKDFKAQSIFDLRESMEYSCLRGVRYKLYDPDDNDYIYNTGGLSRFIETDIEYNLNAITDANFVTWTKTMFTGNAGSDNRYFFVGSGLNQQLHSVGTITKQLEAKSTEVKYGITFTKIETNFGVFYIKHHPLFDKIGWTNYGMILDLNNIEKFIYKPMEVRELELKKTGQRNVNAFVIDETFGLALRYPDTHAIVKPAASS